MSEEIKLAIVGIVGSVLTLAVREAWPKLLNFLRSNSAQRLHERKLANELNEKGYAEVIRRIDWERAQDKECYEKDIAELKEQHNADRDEIHAVRNEHQKCQSQLDRLTWQNTAQQQEIDQLKGKVQRLQERTS